MKLSEKLLIVANWLEDSENDLLVNADSDENKLQIVAQALINASNALKEGAEALLEAEPVWTPEKLDELAAVAQSFDESGDELLAKQASVLDEVLLTLAAPKDALEDFKKSQEYRLEELKKKYKGNKETQDEMNKVSDSLKLIEKAPAYKTYRPLEAPLSTRHCPSHAGVSVVRIGENTWQCPLDKKIYNYETGFKLLDGSDVPGTDVANQTPNYPEESHTMFQTREEKLGLSSS